jgi:hypothetical protein
MGIEPTWDSLHCPTPDLKSGSPTSELGTSGRYITEIPPAVEGFGMKQGRKAQGARRKIKEGEPRSQNSASRKDRTTGGSLTY